MEVALLPRAALIIVVAVELAGGRALRAHRRRCRRWIGVGIDRRRVGEKALEHDREGIRNGVMKLRER